MNKYVEKILNDEIEKHPNELEFNQALEEVLKTISVIFDKHPEYENMKVLEKLVKPDKLIEFKINLLRDNGNLETYDGYRIQFNNSVGVYKGGLRFNSHVNESILKALGFEQTFKNALTTHPMGGAKGGSNFDPKGKSEEEIKRFCTEFMKGLVEHIGEDKDVPAGDLGVGSREINYLFDAYKDIKKNNELGFITGKPIEKGGSLVRKEATGYGLLYFTEEMLKLAGIGMEGKTCAVSGSGNVAIYAIQKAQQLGAKPVTCSDSTGWIYDPEGIDVALLKEVKEGTSIGYNRSYITTKLTKVATVPLGYADGFRRTFSNGWEVMINGKKVPIIGKICMDSFMVDVTSLSEAEIGDEVIIWDNENILLEDLSEKCGTINYEILCSIGERVPRKFK